MLNGNLMDYVGRPIMRKTDAVRGKITSLYNADYDVDGDGKVDDNDLLFDIELDNGEKDTIPARSKSIDASNYRLL